MWGIALQVRAKISLKTASWKHIQSIRRMNMKPRMKRVIPLAQVLLLLLTFCLTLSPGNPVFSSPLKQACEKEQCNGTDPHDMYCDYDASTISQGTFGNAYLELRRSSLCKTYWARTTTVGAFKKYLNATLKFYYYDYSSSTTWGPIWSPQRYSLSGGFSACGLALSTGPISAMVYSPFVP
jgi:hypothetical protein